MTHLPDVTMVIVDTVNHGKAIHAIQKSLEQITPHSTLFFTSHDLELPYCECIPVEIKSKQDYSRFLVKELWRYITTSHVLVIQADGYVLDGNAWDDGFLQYDYIGAPWTYTDGRNVGNGGFSLRSKRLQCVIAADEFIDVLHPEDEIICRLYRTYLEKNASIKFAPDAVAHRFAYEMHPPMLSTFGFHNHFHEPWRKPVVLWRSGAMGDIVMMEPVMEWLYKHGHTVIVNIPDEFYDLFRSHYFPVHHAKNVKHMIPGAIHINLDMAYESMPKQLALLSYYRMCGIADGELRNAKLNVNIGPGDKIFDKYVVFHIDDTAMTHRNVRDIDWAGLQEFFERDGYTVIQIGRGEHRIGTKFNCASLNMMMYVIAGADLFVGIDSGPGQIAVALGVKSVLFFGSVNPKYRYADFSKIKVIQNACDRAGCYHEVIGETGQDCFYDAKKPPCMSFDTDQVISEIAKFIV